LPVELHYNDIYNIVCRNQLKKGVAMSRVYCDCCNSRFFLQDNDVEDVTRNGFVLCEDCMERSFFCPICKNLYVKKNPSERAVDMCKECSAAYGISRSSFSSVWIRTRFLVFMRDNFSCRYCGRSTDEPDVELHCDHIIPKSKGGDDYFDNLITSCSECNQGKLDVMLEKEKIKTLIKRKSKNGWKNINNKTKAKRVIKVEDLKNC
jgi:5-methylcytosine-specific restriction endonuclease McrA